MPDQEPRTGETIVELNVAKLWCQQAINRTAWSAQRALCGL